MRSPRGSDPARSERAEAAARRLALLAADLGGAPPAVGREASGDEPPDRAPTVPGPDWGDYTRVVPARRAIPTGVAEGREPAAVGPAEGTGAGTPASAMPRPGRHAARRPRGIVPATGWSLPRLSPAHLTVIAVLVAVGLAVTAWWVVRDRASPTATPPVVGSSMEPLVAAASDLPQSAGTTTGEGGETGATGETVTVDVTGKVKRPGIVVLDAGARVVDAIDAAGGARPGVDLGAVNLARVLVDGEQIVVGGPAATVPAPAGGTAPPGAPETLVNLNLATQAELESLPDVGPVTATAIIAWRDEHGGFTAVDELLEVSGIGEITLEKLVPYVTV